MKKVLQLKKSLYLCRRYGSDSNYQNALLSNIFE